MMYAVELVYSFEVSANHRIWVVLVVILLWLKRAVGWDRTREEHHQTQLDSSEV